MRASLKTLLLICCTTFFSAGFLTAEDLDIGQIMELSPDKKYMQVNDKVYKVTTVEKMAEPGKQVKGTANDLTEGSLVHVTRGSKHTDFWSADLIIVYQGDLAKTKREEMELAPLTEVAKTPRKNQIKQPAPATDMIFENGVWKN